jgi:hypothetical protein
MPNTLNPAERLVAFDVWNELEHGHPDAHAHLKNSPTKVREVVLQQLVETIEMREMRVMTCGAPPNPFK